MFWLLLIAVLTLDPGTPPEVTVTPTESHMLNAINKYRADRHLPAMVCDPVLEQLARKRVKVFDHHAYGQWSWEAAKQVGFKGFCTDDLAQGYETAEEAVGDHSHGWGDETSHSVGHDMQMKGYFKINGRFVNQHFDLVGVAHQGSNWIAIFGRKGNQQASTSN